MMFKNEKGSGYRQDLSSSSSNAELENNFPLAEAVTEIFWRNASRNKSVVQ